MYGTTLMKFTDRNDNILVNLWANIRGSCSPLADYNHISLILLGYSLRYSLREGDTRGTKGTFIHLYILRICI